MTNFESFIDQLIDELDGDLVTPTVNASHIEEEQAFIILSSDPKQVIQDLTEFTKLGFSHTVGTGELLHIVDTFYDTPGGDIRKSKNSLRVREVNGIPHVTVKGKNEAKGDGSKRSEFEVEWPWQGENQPNPHDVVKLFAMEPIQRRETERIARPILRTYDQELIAELAIDKVTYDFGEDTPAKVYEVEIEMKSDKGAGLKALSDALRKKKKFEDLLWPWNSSKYAMGKVLEHALTVKLDDDGFLTASSFYGLSHLKV